MANKHYDSIFLHFKNNFEANFNYAEKLFESSDPNKAYIHNHEFGAFREELVRKFLRSVVPNKLKISEGFLINRNECTSKQIDLIIYDKDNCPLIEDQLNNRFFPVESVVGIGEVKSILTKSMLKEALKKLAANKEINRDKNPNNIIYRDDDDKSTNNLMVKDKPFSFLICKKLDFVTSNIENEIQELYEEIDVRHWHNFIFSIEDGYIGYQDSKIYTNISWIPTNEDYRNKCMIRPPGESGMAHFRTFAKAINILSFSTTIYRPEIPDYITFDPTSINRFEK